MYRTLYLFRVPELELDVVRHLLARAGERIEALGAAEDAVHVVTEDGGHGFLGLADTLELEADEVLLVQVTTYTDRDRHDDVAAQLDLDDQLGALYNELSESVDLSAGWRMELDGSD